MRKLENGFYTALGTPTDSNGNIVEASLKKQIEQQTEAGAAGLLLLGSMGKEPYIKNSAYRAAVLCAAEANGGRLPLFVGAMDTSIGRVMEKIDLIRGADIDGIVLTVPFYETVTDDEAVNWFSKIADESPYPVFIYDLAVIVKYRIPLSVIDKLIKHKNICGIKTANWELIQAIERLYPERGFACLYSGLDSFDYANMMGIGKNLDGMFACTPKNGGWMADANKKGDFKLARVHLDNILKLRDTMAELDLWPAFTYCMNLLGCEGEFGLDYCSPLKEEAKPVLLSLMREIGEI